MANTNFKIFAESATDLQTDAEYSTDSQRINGVEPGLAVAAMHNKLYKQATIMVAAIAQVLVERGFDAMDNNYDGLVQALRQAFVFSINNTKADANGNISYDLLGFDDIYPVGFIMITADNVNPGTRFGGTWQQIAGGRCLIGANSTYPAGSTGGAATHQLTVNEMPLHNHGVTVSSSGNHKHNRGTMDITGTFAGDDSARAAHYGAAPTGAFYDAGRVNLDLESDSGSGTRVGFQASRTWTGETNSAGAHDHTVTIRNAGGGAAHNNMQPYLAVYIWQRTA